MKMVLSTVCHWLNIEHKPKRFQQDIKWLIEANKSKSRKAGILRSVYAEMVCVCWMYRNNLVYRDSNSNTNDSNTNIGGSIIDMIVQSVWMKPKLREYVVQLLMQF